MYFGRSDRSKQDQQSNRGSQEMRFLDLEMRMFIGSGLLLH